MMKRWLDRIRRAWQYLTRTRPVDDEAVFPEFGSYVKFLEAAVGGVPPNFRCHRWVFGRATERLAERAHNARQRLADFEDEKLIFSAVDFAIRTIEVMMRDFPDEARRGRLDRLLPMLREYKKRQWGDGIPFVLIEFRC